MTSERSRGARGRNPGQKGSLAGLGDGSSRMAHTLVANLRPSAARVPVAQQAPGKGSEWS
jgi:hypothetical protein